MIHPFEKRRARRVLTGTRCSAVLGLALALSGCSSRSSAEAGMTGAKPALSHPSTALAKRTTPAGLATATLGLFHEDELDGSQKLKLAALRENVVSVQRSVGVELLARRDASKSGTAEARDLEGLGSAMAAKQHELLDHTLAGALELRSTLSPQQQLAFVSRAKDSARSARHLAANLAAGGVAGGRTDDQAALARDRAHLLEELAAPAPDEAKVRTLGSAFAAAHARANGAALTTHLQELP